MASRNCAKHALLSTMHPHVVLKLSGTTCFLALGMLLMAVHGVFWGVTPPASYHPPVTSAPSGALSPSATPGNAVVGWELPRPLRLVELPRQPQHLAVIILCTVSASFVSVPQRFLLAGAFSDHCAQYTDPMTATRAVLSLCSVMSCKYVGNAGAAESCYRDSARHAYPCKLAVCAHRHLQRTVRITMLQ